MSKITKSSVYSYLAIYNCNGKLHGSGTNPAVLRSDHNMVCVFATVEDDNYDDFDQFWMEDGLKHRIDGPAVIHKYGEIMMWYNFGLKHRTDGPAVIKSKYEMVWYNKGLKHRKNGPAVITKDGIMKWYLKGKFVRSTEDYNLDGFQVDEDDEEYPDAPIEDRYDDLYKMDENNSMQYKNYDD